MSNNNNTPTRKTFSKSKTITIGQVRNAVAKMRETQIRPDGDGNIRFHVPVDADGNILPVLWQPFDERDSWLLGKPGMKRKPFDLYADLIQFVDKWTPLCRNDKSGRESWVDSVGKDLDMLRAKYGS